MRLILILLPLLLLACSPESRDLHPVWDQPAPPERVRPNELTGSGEYNPTTNVVPQVDILFVLDNSWSMKDEIEAATQNIFRFVDVFTATNQVDFHIGAVTVWDSVRYSTADQQKEVDQFVRDANGELRLQSYGPLRDSEGNFEYTRTCSDQEISDGSCPAKLGLFDDPQNGFLVRNFWDRGELLPVAELHEPSQRMIRNPEAPRFVSRASGNADQVAESLKSLLNVEVIKYEYQKRADGTQVVCDFRGDNPNSRDCTDDGPDSEMAQIIPGTGRGPEIEEIYSPIRAAIMNGAVASGPNS
ncbi:MAG: vWA domain-containing protein [Pseudomonadota bacterium]